MKSKITESFRRIFEPTETAVAARFADRSMMMTPDGEIRLYGVRILEHEDGRKQFHYVVQKSFDFGISFAEESVPPDDPGARVQSPYSGDYLTLLTGSSRPPLPAHIRCEGSEYSAAVQHSLREDKVFLFRSTNGPDGPFTRTKVLDTPLQIQRLPLPLKHRQRWIACAQRWEGDRFRPALLISDDDGRSWRENLLPAPPFQPEICPPHKGLRWLQTGPEPCVAEMPSGRLMMMMRTSVDVHYQCFSDDGGDTWSAMTASIFYSVATMPGIYALSGGRMLAVWNNTTPLPELDHATQPELSEEERNGRWEDVFTNRDALHAAISDDEGRSWRGFREIALNSHRNDGDLRTVGGAWALFDKSVHQNQVLELPENKVLVHYGQHPACTRTMIFDLGFLDATDRKGDFFSGLRDWSTQLYYRSHSGGFRGAGHCSWNRRSGAQLMPSPEGDWKEALLIGRHPDTRLFSDREGAVWNFPGARRGEVNMDLTLGEGGGGARISLADRWINPCDETVGELSPFSFVLDGEGRIGAVKLAAPGRRFRLQLKFDLDKRILEIATELGRMEMALSQTLVSPFGETREISYLHVQSAAKGADDVGVWLHESSMEKTDSRDFPCIRG
ncbi:MAG: sialidase family protein [Victivallaceae bacterium]|nr:sialidase family protein [Victivallaceae bacterium]